MKAIIFITPVYQLNGGIILFIIKLIKTIVLGNTVLYTPNSFTSEFYF